MSDTPLTDEEEDRCRECGLHFVSSDFAKKLELRCAEYERRAAPTAPSGWIAVPKAVVEYCRTMVDSQCRALAIANRSREYQSARQIRSNLDDVLAAAPLPPEEGK